MRYTNNVAVPNTRIGDERCVFPVFFVRYSLAQRDYASKTLQDWCNVETSFINSAQRPPGVTAHVFDL